MKIEIGKRRLEKVLNSEDEMRRKYGPRVSKAIQSRLAVLRNAPNLSAVPTTKPERRHLLKGQRAGQYAVDLVHPYRLVFKPAHTPVPKLPDGGLDTSRIMAITIIEVVDYH